MATDKRQFTMRMQQKNFDKIKYISEQDKRSMAAEIELLIEDKIKSFESEHGSITLSNKDVD